jgi:hypothetical protein
MYTLYLASGEFAFGVGGGLVVDEVDEAEAAVLATLRAVRTRVDDHFQDAF